MTAFRKPGRVDRRDRTPAPQLRIVRCQLSRAPDLQRPVGGPRRSRREQQTIHPRADESTADHDPVSSGRLWRSREHLHMRHHIVSSRDDSSATA